jgi:hypothetical protein
MNYTYKGCYNLTGSPVCGNNVTNMFEAYAGCYNLTGTAIIGPNVVNIYQAYYMCNKINNIVVYPLIPPTGCKNAFYGIDESVPIYVPLNALNNYKNNNAWAIYANRLTPINF